MMLKCVHIYVLIHRSGMKNVLNVFPTMLNGIFEFSPTKPKTFPNVVFTRLVLEDEVRAEHVKLSWEAPEDDGGTPIIKYIVRLLDLDYNEWINVCEVDGF